MSVFFYIIILMIVLFFSKIKKSKNLPSVAIPLICILILLIETNEITAETILISSFLVIPNFLFPKSKIIKKTKFDRSLITFTSIFLIFSILLLVFSLQDSILLLDGLGKSSFISIEEIGLIVVGVISVTVALLFDLVVRKEGSEWS